MLVSNTSMVNSDVGVPSSIRHQFKADPQKWRFLLTVSVLLQLSPNALRRRTAGGEMSGAAAARSHAEGAQACLDDPRVRSIFTKPFSLVGRSTAKGKGNWRQLYTSHHHTTKLKFSASSL